MANKTRVRIESESVAKASEPEDAAEGDGNVVMEQFTREFTAILQLTREKQSKELTSASFGGATDDVVNARQEAACFGDITQKLVPLVDRLVQAAPDQIPTTKKTELLLAFGDKFYQAQEFQAASTFFYEKALALDEMEDSTGNTQGVLGRILASSSPSSRTRSRVDGQACVRSLFGAAMCCFHVQKRSDGLVRHPGRLEKMLEALTLLRLGMELAMGMERHYAGQFSWLTLNGSVLVYSIAKPLQAMGFSKEVVAFLKWSLLAMESAVVLSSTKYVMWRLQLGAAICDCYEDLALKDVAKAEHHVKSAAACAAYLQQAVQRLRKEEELDLPLPAEVQQVLAQAAAATAMLVARTNAACASQPLTRSVIETAFPAAQDQVRAAIDTMEALAREVKQKRGGQGAFALLSSVSAPPANDALVELFDLVMETVAPMLHPMVDAEEPPSSSMPDPALFPLAFHLVLIRHCFQLSTPGDRMTLLIKSARVRVASTCEGLVGTDPAMITCLLELFEALHELQQSWLAWEGLPEDERVQATSKPRLNLPLSGGTVPASRYLARLSTAMTGCVFHGDGAISLTNQELMTSVALQMWRELATPMLKELDATEPPQLSKPLVRLACDVLLAVHFTFTAVKFEDLLLHGQVCLRLATLLSARGRPRTGSQVVRQCLERINSRRSELVTFASHFHSVVDQEKGLRATAPLSNASFSCSIPNPSSSDSPPIDPVNGRDFIGVQGTGSQLGGLNQDLCCVQVDLLLLLYRSELQAATQIDALPLTGTRASSSSSSASAKLSSVLSAAETKLVEECRQNGYAHVLLNIQRLAHPQKSVKERHALADESVQLLQQMESQETTLRRLLAANAEQASSTESAVPAAPVVVSRSSSAITVKVVEYLPALPSLRKKRVQYYMVFAKPAGAGTAVSLNNNRLAGTAVPLYPPHLQATVSGLLPNESYVFAVAAFDSKHELLHSIGETSEPVVALNPLPLHLCYGYLAKACYDAHLAGRARKAAHYLYDAVVSHVGAGRPSWTANPFYRQALKRDAVAQFPIPTLNLCVQALLILCHDEPGDLERDGKLVTSSDLDAHSLTMTQTKALEDTRKISMAIEIACATDDQEAIRVLCFKGYRLLLPFLHLRGSSNGLTFAALVTLYQALHVIPREKWDTDTRTIYARVGFELFRVALEANGDISRVALPLVLAAEPAHSGSITPSDEDDSFREIVDLFKLASSVQSSTSPPVTSAPAPVVAAVASPRGAGAKGAATQASSKDKSQSSTPQATPRSTGDAEKADAGGKMQSLNELLHATGNDLATVFAALEQRSSFDRRAIEYASKICGVLLGSGAYEDVQMERFLASLKVAGAMSSHFRATLGLLGGGSLLPEEKDAGPADAGSPPSARQDQDVAETSSRGNVDPASETVAGADDAYLNRWCGELFFIQSVLLFRKIAKLCATIETVDTASGPDTEDCTYELLHGATNNEEDDGRNAKQEKEVSASTSDGEGAVVDSTGASTPKADLEDTSAENLVANQRDKLFGEMLEKTAACCTLFRLAKCWQALQAAAQQLWNAVWLAWVAPSRIGMSPTRSAQLSSCVDALLDMMDLAVNEAGPPSTAFAGPNTPFSASTEQSMALSTVVYAATSALSVDPTWLARLMAYSLRAFCVLKDWKTIVEKGSRFHRLCGSSVEGGRFSEQNFPVLIYAQQQILNHQERLVQAAEQELSAFIAAFQEQEAKKKKKKSRLVVEEVLSPEEVAFRSSKQVLEHRIQELVAERDVEREKLLDISEIHDGLTKAINKSHQALNTCHELVEKFRRLYHGGNAQQWQQERAALGHQVVAAYSRCVALSLQKRQKRIVCQALQEAGDFHFACGDLKAATKSWLESLDNAFNTLNVGKSWQEVLAPADQFLEGVSNKETIAGDELWIGLQSCGALSKLIMYASSVKVHDAIDYALMAAAIFTRFYACSLPHPTKSFLFGSYRILGQFWPGRKLLTDPDRVSPLSLAVMLVLVPEVLLQYDHQYASTAMPVIAGYEYVAEFCLEDANHVANARRFRVEALGQCGRFQEAFQVLLSLLRGGATPRSSTGGPESDSVVFHDGKSLTDENNRAAVSWLVTFNAEQTRAELRKRYPEALVEQILVSVLHLAVALARHESRFDRDTAIVRSVAKKLAQALLSLVKPSETENSVDGDTLSRRQSISWEELQVRRLRAGIHLQLSHLAFFEGDWNASKTSITNAIAEYDAIPLGADQPLRLELDQKLKFSLLFSRGTFLAKCRSQAIACCLAQTHYRSALETAQLAIAESKATGEEHLRQQLELQRLLAGVFLGEREKTERELLALREDALTAHTSGSLTFIHTVQALSSLLRSKAFLSSDTVALSAVYARLKEAEEMLSTVLERDGWMGVGSARPSEVPQLSKRLSLYRPAVPDFVLVHTALAQVLLECPLVESESVNTRQEKARESVEKGLRALQHTTQPMSATKARLLLLKGVLLSKFISTSSTPDEQKTMQHFEECVELFTECIRSSIEGGYDRQLVRLALIELVDLFGRKLIPEKGDAHVQAAFHYLNLALEVQKHEAVLFDTLELQGGTVTSVDKLPPSVCASIVNAQSEEKEDVSGPPPATCRAPDVTAIVNYFLRLLRMQHILPVCTEALQATCALLHSFLVQHHSAYARVACLTDLPPVPSTDPEIRAGLVCALWGLNLAPALSTESGQSTQNDKLTLYFTLGTTKVSIAEDSPAAGNPAAIARMEKFASSPLLSKRCNLDRNSVQHLKSTVSSLRAQMADEDSLLVERNAFPDKLHLALCAVQHLFGRVLSEGSHGNDGAESLVDAFGNAVSIECTLETVQRVEDLFSINKGVNVADNGLCYFLRDLLD